MISELQVTLSNVLTNPVLKDTLDTVGVSINDLFEDCNLIQRVSGSLNGIDNVMIDWTGGTGTDAFGNVLQFKYVRLVLAVSKDGRSISTALWDLNTVGGLLNYIMRGDDIVLFHAPQKQPIIASDWGGLIFAGNGQDAGFQPAQLEVITIGKGDYL